jgi:hypothetical protein
VGRFSLSCHHFGGWVRIFPTYNLCDNILAPLSGRILNPLLNPNDTLESYPKAFTLDFLVTPPKGHSLSTFLDELLLKLIWRLHLPRTLPLPSLFPLGGSILLRSTKEDLPSSLSLSKPFSTVPFPLLQWLTLGKRTSTNPLTCPLSRIPQYNAKRV